MPTCSRARPSSPAPTGFAAGSRAVRRRGRRRRRRSSTGRRSPRSSSPTRRPARDLEAIVHPEVRRRIAEGIAATPTPTTWSWSTPAADRDGDAPRLRRSSWSCRRRPRRRSPGSSRGGWTEADVRARMAAQLPLEEQGGARPTSCSTTRAPSSRARGAGRRAVGTTRRLTRDPIGILRPCGRAVLFDAGETLVHPAPSFPELFAACSRGAGHERDRSRTCLTASAAVLHRFSEAARRPASCGRPRPSAPRPFWIGVYERMLEELGVAVADGLRDALYERFTDLANYALFDDVPADPRRARRGGPDARDRVELRGVARGPARASACATGSPSV